MCDRRSERDGEDRTGERAHHFDPPFAGFLASGFLASGLAVGAAGAAGLSPPGATRLSPTPLSGLPLGWFRTGGGVSSFLAGADGFCVPASRMSLNSSLSCLSSRWRHRFRRLRSSSVSSFCDHATSTL